MTGSVTRGLSKQCSWDLLRDLRLLVGTNRKDAQTSEESVSNAGWLVITLMVTLVARQTCAVAPLHET